MFMGVFFVYSFSPLLVQWFQSTRGIQQEIDENSSQSNSYLRARFYVGVAIFVLPSLFCALAPKEIARMIDPTAYSISGLAIQQANTLVGNINRNNSIQQSFIAEHANLFRVNVQLSTWARVNHCEATLTLRDDRENIVASQQVDCKTIVDNAFHRFDFEPIADSRGKMYYIEVSSSGTNPNSITAWKSSHDVYPLGKLYINGKENTGDLAIALFYDIQ
jgi:hypothetical protein